MVLSDYKCSWFQDLCFNPTKAAIFIMVGPSLKRLNLASSHSLANFNTESFVYGLLLSSSLK
jgi:hypothetical protein